MVQANESEMASIHTIMGEVLEKLPEVVKINESVISQEADLYSSLQQFNKQRGMAFNAIYAINTLTSSVEKTYRSYTEKINQSVGTDVPGASDVGLSSGGAVSTGGSYGSVSTGVSTAASMSSDLSKSDSDVSIGDKSSEGRKVNEVDVESIVLDLLAPFGLTKEQFSGLRKGSEGDNYTYAVILNNTNKDGKWNPTDIKEYYVKDGKVIGALTGDETYVKVENDKLILDESKSNDFSKVVMSGVGMAGGYFASKTSFNSSSTRAVFETVYPNSTDDEYNNFVDSITKNGEDYEAAAKNVFEKYKNDIIDNTNDNNVSNNGLDTGVSSDALENTNVDSNTTTGIEDVKTSVEGVVETAKEKIEQFNVKDYLVIEDNSIKVDAKGLASELYAEASKLNNIDFKGGLSSEVVFNESTAGKLATYLNDKYSMNIDASTLMGTANNIASTVTTSTANTSVATADSAV